MARITYRSSPAAGLGFLAGDATRIDAGTGGLFGRFHLRDQTSFWSFPTLLSSGPKKAALFPAAELTRWVSSSLFFIKAMKYISALAFLGIFSFFSIVASAQALVMPERTRTNLMVVVRESIGANRTEDAFTPTGKITAKLADGREIELEMAHWEFIGDTHIRFVFDGPQTMINATPQDLERLGLKGIEDALSLALSNIKRTYGEPVASSWEPGIMAVKGKSPDINSSYFLDRSYWKSLLESHPEGLVVCVPKRGGLLYAPLSDESAVTELKRSVHNLYVTSQSLRVSSALFLFKDGKWSVFQAPMKR